METLPPHASRVVPLSPNESILNAWEAQEGTYYLVLTNFRLIFLSGEVAEPSFWSTPTWPDDYKFRIETELDLRKIPPPRFKRAKEDDNYETYDSVLIGGRNFTPIDPDLCEGIVDEISYARAHLLPPDAPTAASQSPGQERQVIIKEVVKVRCHYCKALSPESDTKCSVCGAPLAGR